MWETINIMTDFTDFYIKRTHTPDDSVNRQDHTQVIQVDFRVAIPER